MARKSKEATTPAPASPTPDFTQIRVNRSILPAWTTDRVGVDFSSSQGNYNRDIPSYSEDDIWADYQKEGLLQQIVKRESSKLFTKWFSVVTPGNPDSDLPEQVKEAMEKYEMAIKLPQWHTSRMLFGCGWLMHQLGDVGEDVKGLETAPSGNPEYMDIVPISKKEWVKTERSEDVYRKINYYQFKFGTGKNKVVWNINPERLIMNKNDPLGVAPEGMSEVIGGMGHLEELMDINYMLAVGLRNRCFSIPIIEYPAGMDDAQIKAIEDQFKMINYCDNISIPKGRDEFQNLSISFDRNFSDFGNIQPLVDMKIKLFSTSLGYPYALLFGTPAGGLSGSEMNSREFLSGLSAKLKLEYTPLIRRIIEDWRKFGVIKNKTDKYEIMWPPLYEMTEEEEKKILLLESVRATNLMKIRQEFDFLGSGFIDNNSLSGHVSVVDIPQQVENPNVRKTDIRNPGDEGQALMNKRTTDELIEACRDLQLKVEELQQDADFIRNELAGGAK